MEWLAKPFPDDEGGTEGARFARETEAGIVVPRSGSQDHLVMKDFGFMCHEAVGEVYATLTYLRSVRKSGGKAHKHQTGLEGPNMVMSPSGQKSGTTFGTFTLANPKPQVGFRDSGPQVPIH